MIRLERPGTSCNCYCCGSCSADEIEVQAPAGRLVGHVRQDPSGILHPWFSVVDKLCSKSRGHFWGAVDLRLSLRYTFILLIILLRAIIIKILSEEEGNKVVGTIKKVWGGEAKERYTDAERFEIQCEDIMLHNMHGTSWLIRNNVKVSLIERHP